LQHLAVERETVWVFAGNRRFQFRDRWHASPL